MVPLNQNGILNQNGAADVVVPSLSTRRKQVQDTKLDAERDGVKVPTTLDEYCVRSHVPPTDDGSNLLYDDYYDDEELDEDDDDDEYDNDDCCCDDDDSGNEDS